MSILLRNSKILSSIKYKRNLLPREKSNSSRADTGTGLSVSVSEKFALKWCQVSPSTSYSLSPGACNVVLVTNAFICLRYLGWPDSSNGVLKWCLEAMPKTVWLDFGSHSCCIPRAGGNGGQFCGLESCSESRREDTKTYPWYSPGFRPWAVPLAGLRLSPGVYQLPASWFLVSFHLKGGPGGSWNCWWCQKCRKS